MVQSLLPVACVPDHTALRSHLGPAAEVVARLWPDWPAGHGASRLACEYLLGRSRGWLDISGRPQSGEQGEQAETAWSPRPTVVIDDADGALLAAATVAGPAITAYWDDLRGERRGSAVAGLLTEAGLPQPHTASPDLHVGAPGGPEIFPPGCRVVLAAPKATAALREYLQAAAGLAEEFIVVGREKHMSTAINEELAEVFDRVDVSPGLAKCRLIIGSHPRGGSGAGPAEAAPVFPRSDIRPLRVPGAAPLEVAAYGACYGGTQIDHGTDVLVTSLIDHRAKLTPAAGSHDSAGLTVADLGCGNGWLLANLQGLLNPATSIGIDVSKAALASATATLSTGNPDVQLVLADASAETDPALDALAGSCDLIVLNPPFHTGHTIETGTAHAMIRTAHRMLKPGGRLVCIYNSHLGYRGAVERTFGASRQWARDRKFTVVTAVRGA
ncbi:class I SAM-dependent methyltransferase [Brevibacterium luteolum]|uniref:class I SAM-dependent methyltransferase n=1 Tax=Brevibacterium luteolum TaxID=199591 RepID=UPI00223B99AF|nr:class I SAM-dependent methyltransferase [Brevibacterium luteolum]MCT1921421.1 class I SAM-dependent methyltransferase [Brevibacterium luteolum]